MYHSPKFHCKVREKGKFSNIFPAKLSHYAVLCIVTVHEIKYIVYSDTRIKNLVLAVHFMVKVASVVVHTLTL